MARLLHQKHRINGCLMKKILCVDDDSRMLELLREALVAKGYSVITTTDPAEAPEIFGKENIDLVSLDLDMPVKDGFNLYRELMTIKPAPVLFVSACSRSFKASSNEFMDLYQREFQLGQTDLLYKPFVLSLLYDKVESLVGSCAAA